tara:strand:- start:2269 stop:2574 length:306 start_codon:yes stop_codon:yes gene_type:complete
MKKPNQTIFDLIEIGTIHGLFIEQKQTGSESSDTFCKITGRRGECGGKWSSYKSYLDVQPDWCSVASVRNEYVKMATDWLVYEKENEIELKEYIRLKEIFG